MFDALKKFVAIFTGSKPVTETPKTVAKVPLPPPTPEQEQKKFGFIFPETLPAFKARAASLRQEIVNAHAALEELNNKYTMGGISPRNAADELERRRVMATYRKQVEDAQDEVNRLFSEEQNLVKTFQGIERGRYLYEGTEIIRGQWLDKEKNQYKPETCRVIIQWQGKIMLLRLGRQPILVQGPDRETLPKRTGEYGPVFVDWVTESLDQFNNDELVAVERFQSGTANQ
jgi:hypothetical protein